MNEIKLDPVTVSDNDIRNNLRIVNSHLYARRVKRMTQSLKTLNPLSNTLGANRLAAHYFCDVMTLDETRRGRGENRSDVGPIKDSLKY